MSESMHEHIYVHGHQGGIQASMTPADIRERIAVESAGIRDADIRPLESTGNRDTTSIHDAESPVIASADADAPPAVVARAVPAPFDPSDHDAERARMFRAAGIDVIAMLRDAAATTLRAMQSDDLEHALRGADQAYRLAGAYSGKGSEGKSGKVDVRVNIASFAQPQQ